ncbi:MAG: glycine zipper family protein [Nitrospirota bacterium]
MFKYGRSILLSSALLVLVGCATVPAGPSVMVLPSAGKSFEQFQVEDAICRQWAAQRIGISPQDTASRSVATGAVVGTAIGAGLGAAIGSTTGDAGAGAAIGAASGLLVGSVAGADAGRVYGWEAQRRYDIAYVQCMYAKGNHIPGVVTRTRRIETTSPPPPPGFRSVPPDYSPEPYPSP